MDTAIPTIPAISPQQLAACMGQPDAPLLLDVRREARYIDSPYLLAGAQRCAPEQVAALAATGPPRTVVVYCVYGHEVSQQAAAELCRQGWNASFLLGGFEGGQDGVDAPENIAEWRAADIPRVRKDSTPGAAA